MKICCLFAFVSLACLVAGDTVQLEPSGGILIPVQVADGMRFARSPQYAYGINSAPFSRKHSVQLDPVELPYFGKDNKSAGTSVLSATNIAQYNSSPPSPNIPTSFQPSYASPATFSAFAPLPSYAYHSYPPYQAFSQYGVENYVPAPTTTSDANPTPTKPQLPPPVLVAPVAQSDGTAPQAPAPVPPTPPPTAAAPAAPAADTAPATPTASAPTAAPPNAVSTYPIVPASCPKSYLISCAPRLSPVSCASSAPTTPNMPYVTAFPNNVPQFATPLVKQFY